MFTKTRKNLNFSIGEIKYKSPSEIELFVPIEAIILFRTDKRKLKSS